ncbi:MAG: hypothetical protein EBZ50_01185 [Alphaproteobacteria bacterium]|nr:hypothetical protein [Alphaproteobacteria bacterium]
MCDALDVGFYAECMRPVVRRSGGGADIAFANPAFVAFWVNLRSRPASEDPWTRLELKRFAAPGEDRRAVVLRAREMVALVGDMLARHQMRATMLV